MNLEVSQMLDHLTALFRKIIREELRRPTRTIVEEWVNERDALKLCGRSRKTLIKAINDGRIKPADLRPNPIGTGYLIRRTALAKD
jgi:hypothetical protein